MCESRVTAIMAAYNADATITEAVESVLRQTWRDLVLIVVDDGSSDRTAEILHAVADLRLRVLRNDTNRGLAASLNRAARYASGGYIARMDADDTCHPERIEKQVDFLERRPEVGALGTAVNLIDERGRVFDSRLRDGTDEYQQAQLLSWNPLCHGSVMMRRALFRSLGGYDERFAQAQDCDLWLRFAERTHLAVLDEALYSWRVSRGSVSQVRKAEQNASARLARRLAWQRRLHGRDDFGRELDLNPPAREDRNLLAEHCVIWGREALRQRRRRYASVLFARAVRLYPGCPRLWMALRRMPGSVMNTFLRARQETDSENA